MASNSSPETGEMADAARRIRNGSANNSCTRCAKRDVSRWPRSAIPPGIPGRVFPKFAALPQAPRAGGAAR